MGHSRQHRCGPPDSLLEAALGSWYSKTPSATGPNDETVQGHCH